MTKRFKTLTKAQAAKISKLRCELQECMKDVYAFGENENVPFSECFAAANRLVKQQYEKATSRIWEFERAMVEQGRGYFDGRGSFQAY